MESRITFTERCRIEEMALRNLCNQQIARNLGRHPSTIALEISRGGGRAEYTARKADEIVKELRKIGAANAAECKRQKFLKNKQIAEITEKNPLTELKMLVEQLRTLICNLSDVYNKS